MRHMIDPLDFSVQEVENVLDLADSIAADPSRYREVCRYKKLETACFPDPWSQKSLRDTLREERSFFAVAELGGKIAGYINTTYILDEMELNRICTLPEYRRNGAGKALLRAAFDFATSHGVRAFFLEVRASNTPAQALYKAAGFREAGLRKNYYQNPAEDGLIMRADVGAGDRKEHP